MQPRGEYAKRAAPVRPRAHSLPLLPVRKRMDWPQPHRMHTQACHAAAAEHAAVYARRVQRVARPRARGMYDRIVPSVGLCATLSATVSATVAAATAPHPRRGRPRPRLGPQHRRRERPRAPPLVRLCRRRRAVRVRRAGPRARRSAPRVGVHNDARDDAHAGGRAGARRATPSGLARRRPAEESRGGRCDGGRLRLRRRPRRWRVQACHRAAVAPERAAASRYRMLPRRDRARPRARARAPPPRPFGDAPALPRARALCAAARVWSPPSTCNTTSPHTFTPTMRAAPSCPPPHPPPAYAPSAAGPVDGCARSAARGGTDEFERHAPRSESIQSRGYI